MKKQKRNKNKIKINFFLLFISLILIIGAVLIKKPIVIRPILWLISIILIIINIKKYNKVKNITIILIFILFIFLSFIFDGIIVTTFKKIPVFSYNIISTNKTIVYNSLGIRVWQCDKNDYNNLIVDPFYKKGYMCNAEDIDQIDSNSFLNSIVENYNHYKNTYVKIKGKISKKTGQNYIEMKPYENSDITVNGYVEFADNITLRIIFNNNEETLDNYDIYDEITIVGIIKNLENDSNKYVVYMHDSKVVSNINLNDYTITTTAEAVCSDNSNLIYTSELNNIYTYCLEQIIVSFPDNKYELSTALSSNKISIEKIYENPKSIEEYENDSRKLYKFADYNVIVCDQSLSKDIIIGNNKLSFEDVTCQNKVEEQ